MSTDKSSGVANEKIASDADGSGWERLSDLSDHELVKHIMNELSSLLAGLGVPGKKPTWQLQKAFKKKKLGKSLLDAIRDLIETRNKLAHDGSARAGLPDRNKFINRFLEVKVCLLRLAQEKIPIRAQAGQSSQGFEDALDEMMLTHEAERWLVEMEAELSPAQCMELAPILVSEVKSMMLASMRADPAAASERAASARSARLAKFEQATGMQACAMRKRWAEIRE